MAQHGENNSVEDAVKLLKEHGFDGLAEAVSVLLNAAMLQLPDLHARGPCLPPRHA